MKTTLENKFRFTTMPIPSVDYADGKPYQYIGTTTTTEPIYTNGYFYKRVAQGTKTTEYINDTSNFEKSGNTRCFTITSGNIRVYPSNPDESTAMVKLLTPLSNDGMLKISRFCEGSGQLHDTHICLGTTAGGRDLYVSPTWNDVAQNQTVIDTIDLNQYNVDEIYLSFQMTVKGNDSYGTYDIKSVVMEGQTYAWEQTNVQPTSAGDECQPLTTAQMANIKSQFNPSNTANVNIVPYEIYDEDGEEIIVGEVRKTIDGVKKKKTLYRKMITGVSGSSATPQTILADTTLNVLFVHGNIKHNNIEYWYQIPYLYGNSPSSEYAYVVYNKEVGLQLVSKGDVLNAPFTLVLCYTKTTDEWQPV